MSAFKVPYLCASVKGGAQTHCVNAAYRRNYASLLSPALNGSSEIRRFEHCDVIEIRDRIKLDFYAGLPHRHNKFSVKNSSLYYNICKYIACDC